MQVPPSASAAVYKDLETRGIAALHEIRGFGVRRLDSNEQGRDVGWLATTNF